MQPRSRLSALPQVSQTRTLSDLVPGDQDEKLEVHPRCRDGDRCVAQSQEVDRPPTDQQDIEALSTVADALSKVAGTMPAYPAAARMRRGDFGATDAACGSRPIGPHASRNGGHRAPGDPPLHCSDRSSSPSVSPPKTSSDVAGQVGATTTSAPVLKSCPKAIPKTPRCCASSLPQCWRLNRMQQDPPRTCTKPATLSCEPSSKLESSPSRRSPFCCGSHCVGWAMWCSPSCRFSSPASLHWNYAPCSTFRSILPTSSRCRCCSALALHSRSITLWPGGPARSALLQSSLTRAVIFSAMTTATAFGSLWLSSQPGTSSMGKSTALALVCTMTAAVLFQPALMVPAEKG